MSEVSSRTPAPARGRGSGRGARGGFSNRGGRAASRGHATNGDKESPSDAAAASVEEDGEIGQLRKQYGGKTAMIKEMFPDWSEVDILFALYETEGDENLTVTRIAEGTSRVSMHSDAENAPFCLLTCMSGCMWRAACEDAWTASFRVASRSAIVSQSLAC